MRGTVPAALALVVAMMPAVPALADLPPPIADRRYYGPVRACGPFMSSTYAIDVAAGEGVSIGGGMAVWQPGNVVMIANTSGYVGAQWDDIRVALGTVELPDGSLVERISLGSRSGGKRTIRYLRLVVAGRYADAVEVSSYNFDGTDRDLATLARVRFGEAARAACADVPPALAAIPARENVDAFSVDPAPRKGPLTVCAGGIAFDLRADETVELPWLADRLFFRVTRAGRTSGVEANRPLDAAANTPGALVDDPALVVVPGWEFIGGGPSLGGPDTIYSRLMWRAERAPGHRPMAPVATLSFEAGFANPDQLAFTRRLRAQRPADTCYGTSPA